jgi:hypothetical protein
MLLFDGLVHYDTHVILIGNYVITFACQAVSSPCICGGSGCTLPRRHGWSRPTRRLSVTGRPRCSRRLNVRY